MATWRDFILDSVQTAIFTPDHGAFGMGRAVASVLVKFGDQFEGDMQALPGLDLSPEVPRIELQSGDGNRRLSIAPARFDALWSRSNNDAAPALAEIVRGFAAVHQNYMEQMGLRVGRVALVVRRVFPVENPAQLLIERFCNEASRREPLNRSATFEIHNHKEYVPRRAVGNLTINSWVRCKCGRRMADDVPVVLVEQDLNTLAAELTERRFDAYQIDEYFQMAVGEADEILKIYFPE